MGERPLPDRETIAVYVLLARVLIKISPYDARGALVLLQSMEAAFDRSGSRMFNNEVYFKTALHFNALAGFGNDEIARTDARRSLARVVVHLERLLGPPEHGDLP